MNEPMIPPPAHDPPSRDSRADSTLERPSCFPTSPSSSNLLKDQEKFFLVATAAVASMGSTEDPSSVILHVSPYYTRRQSRRTAEHLYD